ncbi:hypothetical protein [Defluviimonas salinarum]|uniref:Hydroxymethylpyrimidine pyrophosphatase n=1 Tax=Defluviimonas salinarum TaxID=2992147 RepID=A0ABT3J4D6_9RHOB|nr:hypothetical protein [Defluviimonas salinarum]MCW3782528.1 hypothetical protein [Defluviimonas salinarum]
MTPVILADLDDTLFTTLKNYAGRDPASLRRVTTAKNGNHSYLCGRRQAILDWLANGATLVPVTARSLDAYARVHLETFVSGAVLSNGALIIGADGSEDLAWSARVRGHCDLAAPALTELRARMMASGADLRIHDHLHDGVLVGMTAKSNDETPAGVEAILGKARALCEGLAAASRVALHLNGNNLAFVPGGVSKRAAVEHLLATRADLSGRPLIGAGDSASDLPFMELCDMMIVPSGTQNSSKLFSRSGD